MTAANDLGLTTAVPARIEVLVDARLKPIKLGNQEIHFKPAAASRLYLGWPAGHARRPSALLVAGHVAAGRASAGAVAALRRLFADPSHGQAIRDDLRKGLLGACRSGCRSSCATLLSPTRGRRAP